jgi:hypothetical protein
MSDIENVATDDTEKKNISLQTQEINSHFLVENW